MQSKRRFFKIHTPKDFFLNPKLYQSKKNYGGYFLMLG